MGKIKETNMNDAIDTSIGTIYSNFLKQRQARREEIIKEKELKHDENTGEPATEDDQSDDRQLSRKEKEQKAIDSWKDVIVTLTGDDLDYVKPKKSKKKYKTWITADKDDTSIMVDKPKKHKKKNYNKEFEQELSMLKLSVADQNRFTNDLTKRYQIMVGPNTRDAGPLSKTAVELAATVVASRANSLAIIREIGNIKKTVAQLTQKEKELDGKGDDGFDTHDLGMLGSTIAMGMANNSVSTPTADVSVSSSSVDSAGQQPSKEFEEFNPDTWNGNGTQQVDPYIKYESTPRKTLVEYNKNDEKYRYKTINTETGDEIPDYPNPTFEIKSMDENNHVARDSFDTIYDLEVI